MKASVGKYHNDTTFFRCNIYLEEFTNNSTNIYSANKTKLLLRFTYVTPLHQIRHKSQIQKLRFVWPALEDDMGFKMGFKVIIRRYIVTSGMHKCLVFENEKNCLVDYTFCHSNVSIH